MSFQPRACLASTEMEAQLEPDPSTAEHLQSTVTRLDELTDPPTEEHLREATQVRATYS